MPSKAGVRASPGSVSASAALALVLLASLGCVPVRRLPLSKSATAESAGVSATTQEVSASLAFMSQRGGAPSLLAASVTLIHHGNTTVTVDLDRASLVVTDPGGELGERTFAIVSSGVGPTPEAIPLHDAPHALVLAPGESVTVWLAFRNDEPLPEPEQPRRIALVLPIRDGGALSIALADPATGRPRWTNPSVRSAGYGGLSALTNFDEASFGVLRGSSKNVAGPLVIGPSVSFGVRAGAVRGERERTIACCDLGLGFDVSMPFRFQRTGSAGPYLAYQAAFAVESGRIDKAAWHGPAAGFQFFSRLIEPNTARALPIASEPTVLGYSSFTVAYAHLFRRGDSGGRPAMLVMFEQTLPEW